MNIIEIINKKKKNEILSNEEIKYFVEGYTTGELPDYQISSLLMAIRLNGMTNDETVNLTKAYIESGDIINLDSLSKMTVDKHSTGGVGDKTSLILGPILATFDLAVAKMSGRGLGHTGGTIDKLESIAGFQTEISEEQFLSQVEDINIAIAGQTANLVPADKKIYALRDVTGTVDSPELIAASVMSKKIASGSKIIVLDVKYGTGAFMKDVKSAVELAKILVEIGESFGRKTTALITNMNEPLGINIGNALEIEESIQVLRGEGPKDLKEVVNELASSALMSANLAKSKEEALKLIEEKINSGQAYEKFLQFVNIQGGQIKELEKHLATKYTEVITATKTGYVKEINTELVGTVAVELGAGRKFLGEELDMAAGIRWFVKIGDIINEGDPICELKYNKEIDLSALEKMIRESIMLSKDKINHPKLIEEIIKKES